MAILLYGTGQATGNTLSLDVGPNTAGRKVLIGLAHEEIRDANGVTVGGVACTLAGRWENTNGVGQHQEWWYVDTALTATGTLTVSLDALTGGNDWGIIAGVYTGLAAGGPTASFANITSVNTANLFTDATNAANELGVYGASNGGSSQPNIWYSGFTERQDDSNSYPQSSVFAFGDQIWTSANASAVSYQVNHGGSYNRAVGVITTWAPLPAGQAPTIDLVARAA